MDRMKHNRKTQTICIFNILSAVLTFVIVSAEWVVEEDLLLPYGQHNSHGPLKYKYRHIRSLQPPEYRNETDEIYPAHASAYVKLPIVYQRNFFESFGEFWSQRKVLGHYFLIHNPAQTLSVIEPGYPGGCTDKNRDTVVTTARSNDCILAINGGFFNTKTNECLGDIVSNGVVVQEPRNQNVHFGIRKDGNLFFGYIDEGTDLDQEFEQLISGVIWLVRDGKNHVETSILYESSDTQETGSLRDFVDVISARTSIGCDRDGRIVIVQMEGKTRQNGVNLNELADKLIEWGVVNAINLDGGGSATAVVNETLINYPSDLCTGDDGTYPPTYSCARKVTTAICIHEPVCHPPDCNGNGDCSVGKCHCRDNWVGPGCSELQCGVTNCSTHGHCTADGCFCSPGRVGEWCQEPCPPGKYGLFCLADCRCKHNTTCDPIDGSCDCPAGLGGLLCERTCDYGFYGPGCAHICNCSSSCGCHPETGLCNIDYASQSFYEGALCYATEYIEKKHLVPSNEAEIGNYLVALVIFAVLCAICIAVVLCVIYQGQTSSSTPSAYHKIDPAALHLNNIPDSPEESDSEDDKNLENRGDIDNSCS